MAEDYLRMVRQGYQQAAEEEWARMQAAERQALRTAEEKRRLEQDAEVRRHRQEKIDEELRKLRHAASQKAIIILQHVSSSFPLITQAVQSNVSFDAVSLRLWLRWGNKIELTQGELDWVTRWRKEPLGLLAGLRAGRVPEKILHRDCCEIGVHVTGAGEGSCVCVGYVFSLPVQSFLIDPRTFVEEIGRQIYHAKPQQLYLYKGRDHWRNEPPSQGGSGYTEAINTSG